MDDSPELIVAGCALKLAVGADVDWHDVLLPLHPEFIRGVTPDPHAQAKLDIYRSKPENTAADISIPLRKRSICKYTLYSQFLPVFLDRHVKGWE
jgi:hypothetical protein